MALGEVGWFLAQEARDTVPPDLPLDARLARDAARGDRPAFARLVELHKRAVFGLCQRLLQHPEEARDAAQETFVRAWGAVATYDPANPFAPWLLRIARNHCLDLLRRRLSAGRQVPLGPAAEGEDEPSLELADATAPGADELLARAQDASALGAAVESLPPKYREVIHLFHVEHMSYKEIAATLEVPIGTVMTWLHRARGRLRDALQRKELS